MRSSRTELLLAVTLAATLLVLGLAFGASRGTHDDPRASTFVDGEHGLRAIHLVLQEAGAEPRRSMSAASATDPTDRTLVLANPSEALTKHEVAQLAAWVRAGGRLVIIDGSPPVGSLQSFATPVFEAFGLRRQDMPKPAGDGVRAANDALAADLGVIEWPATAAIFERTAPPGAGKFEPLVTSDSWPLAGRRTFGDAGGEVVALSDPKLLENAAFARADNAVLAARILAGRGAVVFDEFHHGFREGDGADRLPAILAKMLVDTWPGRALLVLAIAGLVHLAGAAVRLGAPEREGPRPRRALSEHAEALGRIFERVEARRETLAILAAGARRVAGPRSGIPASLPPAEFLRRLRSSHSDGAAEFADALEHADAGGAAKEVQMAELAANLAAARRRFLHGG